MAQRSNPIYRALNRPLTILGAERKLFFVAGATGLAGGGLGVAPDWAIGRVINFGTNLYLRRRDLPGENIWSVPWWLVGGAIGFAVLVSLAVGIYPAARRAARPGAGAALRIIPPKTEPGRSAEGPERPGFSCPPPQVVDKNWFTQDVRRRAETRSVRWPPPHQSARGSRIQCAGCGPGNAPSPGRPE